MALIKCKECEHSISDKAHSCPQCGCPIEKNGIIRKSERVCRPIGGYLALIVGIFILFPSIFSFLGRTIGFWHYQDFSPLMVYSFRSSTLVTIGALFLVLYGISSIGKYRRTYWKSNKSLLDNSVGCAHSEPKLIIEHKLQHRRPWMKKLKPLVPALLSFGPIMMVMGLNSNTANTFGYIVALVGALMLSVGCCYLFRQLTILGEQTDPSENNI